MTTFESHFPPMASRTHEVCGPSAIAFAVALGARLGGKVLWVREAWRGEQINPVGVAPYFDPKHLLLAQAPSHLDVLASAEEALRSGNVALVVMELTQPVYLTEGRRLQLAAQCMYRLLFANDFWHVLGSRLYVFGLLIDTRAVALLGLRTRRDLISGQVDYDHLGRQTLGA